jgi:hypothetical protein
MASGGAVLYRSVRRSGPARVFRLPADVLATLRRERTWHPVPRFYAFVLGFTLVLAALLAAVTGDPRRASRRRACREAAVARRALAVLPAVVPFAWAGGVGLGGVGYSGPRRGEPQPCELSVIADQDGSLRSSPRLTIRVSGGGDPAEDDEQLLRRFAQSELAPPPGGRDELDLAALDRCEAEAAIDAWREEVESLVEQRVRLLVEAWQPTDVRVDGETVARSARWCPCSSRLSALSFPGRHAGSRTSLGR